MLRIKEAVVVEGKYDKIKLKGIIDAPIIETNGFRVFKDKEKQNLIRQLASKRGLLIITDSDSAGFVIRNFLKGIVKISFVDGERFLIIVFSFSISDLISESILKSVTTTQLYSLINGITSQATAISFSSLLLSKLWKLNSGGSSPIIAFTSCFVYVFTKNFSSP